MILSNPPLVKEVGWGYNRCNYRHSPEAQVKTAIMASNGFSSVTSLLVINRKYPQLIWTDFSFVLRSEKVHCVGDVSFSSRLSVSSVAISVLVLLPGRGVEKACLSSDSSEWDPLFGSII